MIFFRYNSNIVSFALHVRAFIRVIRLKMRIYFEFLVRYEYFVTIYKLEMIIAIIYFKIFYDYIPMIILCIKIIILYLKFKKK